MILSRDLACQYPGGTRLTFPDIAVPQGGVLLLRGRSGSGKSSWLALAAGLMAPSAGVIEVAGQSLGALPPLQRDAWRARQVGFLPQTLHLDRKSVV